MTNLATVDEIRQMLGRGWTIRRWEPRPDEGRVLVLLHHPDQWLGTGADRYRTAVETHRSLPIDTPEFDDLTLF